MAVITTLVLSALCAGTVTAGMDWGFGAALVATRAPVNTEPERTTTSATLSGTLAEVMAQLEAIHLMPRCKQAATKDLVHFCAKHHPVGPQSSRNTQAGVDIYEQHFAIRITHCELESAGKSLPSACDQIVADGCTTSGCHTESCLKALSGEINAWTTYTASKNHGIVMCHAMRAEHDQEEKIRLLKFLIERTSDIGTALEMSQHGLEQLTQKLRDVEYSTRTFYKDMTDSTRDFRSEMKQSFHEIHKDTSGISDVVQSLYSSMDQAKKHFDDHLAQVSYQAQALTAQKDDESRAQLAHFQSEMEDFRNLYRFQFERFLEDLNKDIFAITKNVKTAGTATGQMLNKFDTLHGHLDNSNHKMDNLLVQIINASDIQEQATAQLQDAVGPLVHELQGFRETVGWLIFWPKTIRKTVQFLRGPDVQLFMKSYGLILPFAAMACWVMGSGSAIALLGTCCLALFITMTNSLRVTQDGVDAHASFYCKASPYVVNLAYSVAGAVIATIICRSYFRPKYDPAAQLDPYTGLDDLDIAEQKQNRSRC